jgi:hypothetical protein
MGTETVGDPGVFVRLTAVRESHPAFPGLAGPLPRPNHPLKVTLWVVGPGERAGQAKPIAEAIGAPNQ